MRFKIYKLGRRIFIMKYTIKVNEVNKESNIKAMASVVFGDSFKVGNIAVVERKDGELFVAMPQFRSNSKDQYGHDVYKSVCNPITKEFRQQLFDNILATYASEQKERTIETKDRNDNFKLHIVNNNKLHSLFNINNECLISYDVLLYYLVMLSIIGNSISLSSMKL